MPERAYCLPTRAQDMFRVAVAAKPKLRRPPTISQRSGRCSFLVEPAPSGRLHDSPDGPQPGERPIDAVFKASSSPNRRSSGFRLNPRARKQVIAAGRFDVAQCRLRMAVVFWVASQPAQISEIFRKG